MKQLPLYEQLSLPEPTPEDEPLTTEAPQAPGLTDEEEREFELQDSKAGSHNIIRARMGRVATDLAVEPVDHDKPEDAKSAQGSQSTRRRSRRQTYKNGRLKISGPRTAAALRHADQRPDKKPFPYGSRED